MLMALFILLCLIGVGAVEKLHQQSSVSAATHSTSLAHALKSKRSRLKASQVAALRGIAANAKEADDDDGEDDDDDDDDDTDDSKGAAPVATIVQAVATAEKTKGSDKTVAANAVQNKDAHAEKAKAADKAAEQEKKKKAAAAKKAKDDAEAALDAAIRKQDKLEHNVAHFKDDEAFDTKIAEETKLMTNETQSPALASFLGSLRTEMREYAMPAYPKYLQGELEEANKKVIILEKKLHNKDAAKKAEAKKVAKEKSDEAETKETITKEGKGVESAAEADAKQVAQAAGEVWAISFFANIALLTAVFAMASAADTLVKNYTWFLIDQVVAIFLAVMYFQAFDSLLDFHSMGVHDAVFASIIHAVAMLAIVLGAAIALRKQQVALAILCGAGAHIVSFSSIHAAASAQNHFLGMSYTYTMCIFGICTLGLAIGTIGFLVYTSKKRMDLTEDDGFMDKTDDLENDFGAMAFSVVFTMFMRFMLTGHHPVDDETEFDHTREQRTAMFFYAIACVIVAGFVVSFCSKKAADPSSTYAIKRVMNFITTVATMNVAWAWLYWGEWEFFEALYPGEAIKGRVMFAITMSLIGGLGLIGLSKMSASKGAKQSEKKVALTALSLVIAWSWELCFDAAVEDMCEGVAHPVGWKVAATLFLAAIIIPVYAIYMKPITMKAAEAIGA